MSARKVGSVVCIMFGIMLAGCVSLKSYQVASDKAPQQFEEDAIVYILPKTRIDVLATFELECTEQTPDGKPADAVIKISPTVSATAVTIQDEKERYFIKPSDMQGWFKDAKITIDTNANQTLSGANGTINDSTGAVIGNAIGATVTLAGLKIPSVTPLSQTRYKALLKELIKKPGFVLPTTKCDALLNEDTAKALYKVHDLKAELAELQEARLKALETLMKPVTARKEDLEDADAPETGKSSQPNLATVELYYATKIADLNDKISKLKGANLTLKTDYLWEPAAAESQIVITDFAVATIQDQWIRDKKPLPSPLQKITLKLTPKPWSVPEGTVHALPAIPHRKYVAEGLVLRSPAIVKLSICKGDCPAQSADTIRVVNGVIAEADNIALPQFGSRQIIPLKNKPFRNSALTLALWPDGTIKSVSPSQTSTLDKGLASLQSGLATATTVQTAANTAQTAANTAASGAVGFANTTNKAYLDCLKARKDILDLGGNPPMTCE
ncbi:hypothetical protein [Asticcacaulis endophyticus]|uniref:Uncharacterized protein n=1 Tax=Asticcacaulis endophyticus TaxID=1395890 RepID=A0A918UTM9_9CAUL|nr:hypothetical protein [Asticcacaulis endophyticus]GGZ32340.1 hypothetical protein GCM10011273_18080 [Asticcacaulis endophyticus]